ncbi:hypothetical protein GPECTOR_65g155 [Gonium pectorale]|uniref:Uncharacterized protein n=1 Tax=Gonium pectorale TaxID=33097 RepID=A0A150G3V6_GONPE|nr:hypothetical protein GPECTOR_65g155 [Gonium pectorale]|eukprot:KXZ44537.1 hypothetical protein GPECTOR_65g155 [Gonium pectorale]
MAPLTVRTGVGVIPCRRYQARLLSVQKFPARLAVPVKGSTVSEVAVLADATVSDLASAFTAVTSSPEIREAGSFLLEHPVASFAISVGAVLLIPKLIEAFVRYLAAPVAIALVAFYTIENPEESATMVTTVLEWINAHPELTSLLALGLALFGLAPALLTAFGATALIYGLLSISFGTQLPEVREMQGEFKETVSRVQLLTSVAGLRFQQLQQLLK